MVDLILSNLVCIVLDLAGQHCLFPTSSHRTASTKCGVETAAISCVGVEVSLQALQVPGFDKKLY